MKNFRSGETRFQDLYSYRPRGDRQTGVTRTSLKKLARAALGVRRPANLQKGIRAAGTDPSRTPLMVRGRGVLDIFGGLVDGLATLQKALRWPGNSAVQVCRNDKLPQGTTSHRI